MTGVRRIQNWRVFDGSVDAFDPSSWTGLTKPIATRLLAEVREVALGLLLVDAFWTREDTGNDH
jgi:hypothetical protein